MLTELQISNFAIIDNQSITFTPGLNVLTGETGSGKSIVLAALELILGGRSSTQHIRSGCESLEVHAHFDLSGLTEDLRRELPDMAQGDELAVSRSLSKSGRGKVYINGNVSTVAVLSQIGNRLINICSQSQQVLLLDPQYHLTLLDGYLGETAALSAYRKLFTQWQEKHREVEKVRAALAQREVRGIWLEETIEELESVDIKVGLRQELETAHKKILLREKIAERIRIVEEQFEDEAGLLSNFTKTLHAVNDLVKYDSVYAKALAHLENAKELLFEADRVIRRQGNFS